MESCSAASWSLVVGALFLGAFIGVLAMALANMGRLNSSDDQMDVEQADALR